AEQGRRAFCPCQVPLGRLQRPPGQLIPRGYRRQLRIRDELLGGEPGEQLMDDRGLPVQIQARPVIGEQPPGQVPVPAPLAPPHPPPPPPPPPHPPPPLP